jgi:hypothetical protein
MLAHLLGKLDGRLRSLKIGLFEKIKKLKKKKEKKKKPNHNLNFFFFPSGIRPQRQVCLKRKKKGQIIIWNGFEKIKEARSLLWRLFNFNRK